MASTSSTATGRSVNCSGVNTPKIETSGPTGMIAKLMNAGVTAMSGARMNTILSTPSGMMSSFSPSLIPSAIDWSSPNGPARLGPRRFCMRPITRRSAQMANSVMHEEEDEDEDGLEDDQPPRIMAETPRGSGPPWRWRDAWARKFIRLSRRTPGRRRRHQARGAPRSRPNWPGSQTTRSGITVTSAGTVRAPRLVLMVILSPSATPISRAVAADSRANTGRAVPARNGSPSCIRPASRS